MRRDFDVVVVGGGAAGVASALSAARRGARVVLLERNGFLGGMATAARVGTICGLYLRDVEARQPRFALEGIAQEFAERLCALTGAFPIKVSDGLFCLPYRCTELRQFFDQFVEHRNIELRLHATVTGVKIGDGGYCVSGLWWNTPFELFAHSLIDCTGEASASLLAHFPTVEPERGQAMSAVFDLASIAPIPTSSLPLLLAREMLRGIQDGGLPLACERLSVVPGSHVENRVTLKLGIPGSLLAHPSELSCLEVATRQYVTFIHRFLRASVEEFKRAELCNLYTHLGVRAGRRAIGLTSLSRSDVLQSRRPPNGVAIGAWPIERWDSHKRPTLEFFSEKTAYLIGTGCLQAAHASRFFFAGRHICADEDAIASARVIGTCLSTGAAAGALAVSALEAHDEERSIALLRREQGIAEQEEFDAMSSRVTF